MMKWNKVPVFVIYFCLGLTIWLFYPVSENWLPSYHPQDKIPYGTHILRQGISKQSILSFEDLSIDSLLLKADAAGAHLLFINDRFEPNETEMSALMQYVKKGGKILLTTSAINYVVVDSLQVEWDYLTSVPDSSTQNCFTEKWIYPSSQRCFPYKSPNLASACIKNSDIENELYDTFHYKRDTLMALNDSGQITALQLSLGKGSWILHSQPAAFSNFGLLHGHQHHANALLSLINGKPILWDVHFIKRSFSTQPNADYSGSVLAHQQKSPLSEVLKHDLLRWAYWLLFSGILLYFILLIKRKVRAMPVWKAPGNESVNFIRLIASVYLSGNDNKAILTKKLRMFLIHINQVYGIRDFDWSDEAKVLLCSLSGYDPVKLDLLSKIALNYTKGEQVSFVYLSSANNLINDFIYASKMNS